MSMTQLWRSAHSTLRLSISCAFLLSERPPTTASPAWASAELLPGAAAGAEPLRWLEGRRLLGGLEAEKLIVAVRPRPLRPYMPESPPCSNPLLSILARPCSKVRKAILRIPSP